MRLAEKPEEFAKALEAISGAGALIIEGIIIQKLTRSYDRFRLCFNNQTLMATVLRNEISDFVPNVSVHKLG